MAQLSNTFETYDAIGVRESLHNKIFNISPHETPFISMIGSSSTTSTNPEWQIQTNANPDTTNNQPEGNEWDFDATTPTTRVGNYTQISDKKVIVTGTVEKVDKAGRKSELSMQVAKNGVELRTDMEAILLSNQASSAGSGDAVTNRTTGGFRAWLTTNTDLGAGGADGGATGSAVTAATNGTQRAFTKTILDANILSAYNAGGNPDFCMMSPYVKQVFSTFMDNANVVPLRQAAKAKKGNVVIASVDAYLSDFGLINMVPNRQMARAGAAVARNAFIVDPNMVSLKTLRPIKIETPAKTGDSEKRVLICEYALCVNNEASHSVAADLFGLTSST